MVARAAPLPLNHHSLLHALSQAVATVYELAECQGQSIQLNLTDFAWSCDSVGCAHVPRAWNACTARWADGTDIA
jgi:hypothetical protein